VFRGDRFALVDVGCSGGIDPLWRLFRDQLEAYAFDPQKTECRRLQQEEANPHVHYCAYAIGLEEGHPYHTSKGLEASGASSYLRDTWGRLSAIEAQRMAGDGPAHSNPIGIDLTGETISVSRFARDHGIENIDFIKIDTDGHDLEAALSCEELIRRCQILGFMIEVPLTGSHHDWENSFHNIDRYMRQQGFALYTLSLNRYSRRDLPAPFVYDIFAQTTSGQVVSGDAVYLRDGASDGYLEFLGQELSARKCLKLACLYELFQMPDCAAELVNKHAGKISEIISPDVLLERLTPRVRGRQVSYKNYVHAFEENPRLFLPSSWCRSAS
jgi:FkbM family methyltransferase